MKKYESPDIKITYFVTNETMTGDAYPSPDPLSAANPLNLFSGDEKVAVGSIDFETLK